MMWIIGAPYVSLENSPLATALKRQQALDKAVRNAIPCEQLRDLENCIAHKDMLSFVYPHIQSIRKSFHRIMESASDTNNSDIS